MRHQLSLFEDPEQKGDFSVGVDGRLQDWAYQDDSEAIWSIVGDYGLEFRSDEFFAADLYNNGKPAVIHKGRSISDAKYYDDYHWFQIYDDKDMFDADHATIVSPDFSTDDFWGVHSGGNLYERFPVEYDVIDFWTESFEGKTYCVTLQKMNVLYVTNIFLIQDDTVERVSRSMYIEEPQSPAITFE